MYNKILAAKNRGVRRGTVQFIVLHDTAGSGTSSDAQYLANDPEHRGISVDYCITKDGTVWELNHDLSGHCTYHAGRHTRFRDYVNGGVNQHSVGIEISQKANMRGQDPLYPHVQVIAVAQVCVDLCKRFGLNKTDITTHAAIIQDGSRTDPRSFPWDEFWARFRELTMDDEAIPDHAGQPVIHKVIAGDTLWAIAAKYSTSVEAIKALNNMNEPSNVIHPGLELVVHQ